MKKLSITLLLACFLLAGCAHQNTTEGTSLKDETTEAQTALETVTNGEGLEMTLYFDDEQTENEETAEPTQTEGTTAENTTVQGNGKIRYDLPVIPLT